MTKKLKSVKTEEVSNKITLQYETTIAGFGSPTNFKGTKTIQNDKITAMTGWIPSSNAQIAETGLVHLAKYDNSMAPTAIFCSSATNLLAMIETAAQ